MSLKDGEFCFWTEHGIGHSVESLDLGQYRSMDEKRVGDGDEDHPSYPLLPSGHQYSSPASASWRSQAIEQGRRELMEMVRAMPKSSFELSLKDIVDKQQSWKGKEVDSVDREVDKEKQKICKKRKKVNPAGTVKKADRRQVPRTSSVKSGTVMIKLFFPAFLMTKKASSKTKRRNQLTSKVSPRTSTDGTKHPEDCKLLKITTTNAAAEPKSPENRNGCKSYNSKRSSSCRGCNREPVPSCWPFEIMKGKLRRQRTCNF